MYMEFFEIQLLDILLSENPNKDDDKAFRAIMKCVGHDITIKSVADKFGVNRSTVNRWVNGQSVPHPAARPRIYTWLRSQVKKLLVS